MLPDVTMLPEVVIAPVTPNDVSVPTEVIAGCAALRTTSEDPVMLPDIAPAKLPTKLEAVTLPTTVSTVKLPRVVIFGCAEVVSVPLIPVLADSVDAAIAPPDEMLPVLIAFVTDRLPRVPTELMLGCAFVVSTPPRNGAENDAVVICPPTFKLPPTLNPPAPVICTAP